MVDKDKINKEEKKDISYELLWKAIIRPERDNYIESELGEAKYVHNNKAYTRNDYTLINKKGLLLKASFIQLDRTENNLKVMPVVIYLHSNASSRLEGMKLFPYLFEHNINLLLFDFSGSGLSEGEFISLGWYEKEDIKIIIDFIEKQPGVGKIGLWGRSMGAATVLMYSSGDNRIKAICVDSPFCDFKVLAKELCKKYANIPGFVTETALVFIKKSVKKKNEFDLDDIKPIKYVRNIRIPGLFIHALNDEMVPMNHSIKLYHNYSGEKILSICDGGHNSARLKHINEKIGCFFKSKLYL